jgi:ABC-2 type transport system permease protein
VSSRAGRIADVELLGGQIAHQNRIFRRTPIAAFFTLVFPLMLLVIFAGIFQGQTVDVGTGEIDIAQFYAPSLAAFAAVSATFTNLAVGVCISRDDGILKRVRGTPLPPWVYLGGQIGNGIVVAAIAVGIMMTVAALAYGVSIRLEAIPAAVIAFLVGVAAFAALGLAVSALTPNAAAAPAVANAIILPLAFVSNVFIPLENPPLWLDVIGNVFPLKPFVTAFSEPFSPFSTGAAFAWRELAVVAAWGIAGGIAAARYFRWEPRPGSRGRRASRRAASA